VGFSICRLKNPLFKASSAYMTQNDLLITLPLGLGNELEDVLSVRR
jgi:hypothetical protein